VETTKTPGMDALREYRRRLDAGEIEPQPTKTPWEKLRANPTAHRRIVAFCHQCMGWEEGKERPPGIVQDIRACTASGCPLFGARPFRT